MTAQQQRVLTFLEKKGSINPLQAWIELSVYRLSDVIYVLRKSFDIETKQTTSKNKYDENVRFATYVYIGAKDV